MNYYQFHVGDYATHSRYLTLMQDLAYRRLLDLYYTTEQPIPLDVAKASRLIGMQDHMQSVSEILSDYFLKSEAGYINKRCDEEIERYKAKAGRAKKANEARWKSEDDLISETQSDLKSDQLSERNQLPTNNQQPITNNQLKSKKHIRASRFDALAHLVSENVPEDLASDWLTLRKEKRLTPTKTAIDGIKREAGNCGKSLADVVRICCERGWGGFKHEWLERDVTQLQNSQARAGPSAFQSKAASAIMQLQGLKNAIRERNNGGFGGGINRENGSGSMVCIDLDRSNSEDVLPGLGLSAAS